MQLVIDTADTTLTVRNQCFYVQRNKFRRQISPKRVSSVAILSNVLISSSAIMMAAKHQIPILYFNRMGSIQARTWSPYFTNIASLRKKQMYFEKLPEATQWVVDCLHLKLHRQIATLNQLAHQRPSQLGNVAEVTTKMKLLKAQMLEVTNIPIIECRNTLMGLEGSSSRYYWSTIPTSLPEPFQFSGRSRRPAQDYFNAALNYLYGMTYSVVESAVFATGLDPFIGYLHTENYRRTSLVFDMIEPFRPYIDQLLINLCRQKQLESQHFRTKGEGYWLSKEGKRLLIPQFNEYMLQRKQLGSRVRSLKDHIYAYSNELAQRIRQAIPSKSEK